MPKLQDAWDLIKSSLDAEFSTEELSECKVGSVKELALSWKYLRRGYIDRRERYKGKSGAAAASGNRFLVIVLRNNFVACNNFVQCKTDLRILVKMFNAEKCEGPQT